MFQEDSKAIAVVVLTDDYGNVSNLDFYPPVGSIQTITYIDDGHDIDSRTGNLCDETRHRNIYSFRFQKAMMQNIQYVLMSQCHTL